MDKYLFYIALVLVPFTSVSQNWIGVGPKFNHPAHNINILYNVGDTMLLALGEFISVNDSLANGLAIYKNGQWYGWPILGKNYGPGSQACLAPSGVCSYDNKIVFASTDFSNTGDGPFYQIRAWNGNDFDTLGKTNSPICRLKVIQDELYAYGWFTKINGMSCRGLAKWDGTNWRDLNPPFGYGGPQIADICIYDNKLWVGGNFSGPKNVPYNEIAYLDLSDSTWNDLDSGIRQDVYAGVGSLTVYEDELYIGGSFRYDMGNAGHNIMKWDGEEFVDVGGGIFGQYYAFSTWASSRAFIEFRGDLWVGGSFEWIGGIKQTDFGIWNGQEWCVTGDSTYPGVRGFAVFQDSLYMLTRHINGDTVNSVAKWVGSNYRDTCGTWPLWPHGIGESETQRISVYPNPVTDFLQVEFSAPRLAYRLFDLTGKQVAYGNIGTGEGIELGHLQPGMYLLRIDNDPSGVFKIVKQ